MRTVLRAAAFTHLAESARRLATFQLFAFAIVLAWVR